MEMNEIIQLKITLKGTKPPIWRRILVEKNTTFFKLHHIIQIVMGWGNYHLYEFNVHNYRIGEQDDEFDDFAFGDDELIPSSTVTLDSFLSKEKEKFEYVYDFGDSWVHQITVEKFLPRDNSINYPVCTDGKLNCPPEDCGGIWGFYRLLEIIADKNHPEHEEMLEWIGEQYDPNYFEKDEINSDLKMLDEYIKSLE